MNKIPSVLACDVGNSAIHFAHVYGENVEAVQSFSIGKLEGLGKALQETWSQMPEPRKVVAGSVNPAGLKALEATVDNVLGEPVLVIARDLPLPMETRVEHPEAIGVDRLCCATAAFDHLGVACVVADFGTAITIDCVDEEGVFRC